MLKRVYDSEKETDLAEFKFLAKRVLDLQNKERVLMRPLIQSASGHKRNYISLFILSCNGCTFLRNMLEDFLSDLQIIH